MNNNEVKERNILLQGKDFTVFEDGGITHEIPLTNIIYELAGEIKNARAEFNYEKAKLKTENKQLKEKLYIYESHEPDGRNISNSQWIELCNKNDTLTQKLEKAREYIKNNGFDQWNEQEYKQVLNEINNATNS